ncbi:MAG: chloride channel protein [Firmicutes bacterium]|nr:chloride channel protein [Bacillota bacterium]MBR3748823.1 chloride channel protein [Bacillota bacterium]MBR4142976.1 chloride channel protein [Bacillota bacterium]MBR6970577.1 chloride channel protein [Bacillota bacterium]
MQPKTKKLRDTVSFRTVDVLQWCVYAVVVGVVCGTIAAAFGMVIDAATAARQKYDWLVWLMPAAGLAIVGMYHLSGITKPLGTNRVLLAVKEEEGVAIRMAPLIYISSMLTHLTGGSSGREGAALQIGGSVANFIGRQFKLSHLDLRTITMCGMAAGFSGLFGTPLAAGIFAMEIADGTLHYAVLLPCMLSSIVARVTAEKFGIQAAAFTVTGYPDLTLHSVLAVLVFGVMCALLSILFVEVLHCIDWTYAQYLKNPYLRIAVAGLIVAAGTTLLGTRDYNGAGTEVIVRALAGEARPEAFLLKILFTALTLEAGFKGGEIVPTFFIGATFGCTFAPLIGLDPSFAAALGMTALFCGVTNCPIASMLLSFELFGGQGLVLFALCCSMSYMLSGHFSLYTAQRLEQDKFHLE